MQVSVCVNCKTEGRHDRWPEYDDNLCQTLSGEHKPRKINFLRPGLNTAEEPDHLGRKNSNWWLALGFRVRPRNKTPATNGTVWVPKNGKKKQECQIKRLKYHWPAFLITITNLFLPYNIPRVLPSTFERWRQSFRPKIQNVWSEKCIL